MCGRVAELSNSIHLQQVRNPAKTRLELTNLLHELERTEGLSERRIVRRAMQGYWRFTRSLTMGAQGVVMRDEAEVLLVRHTYRPGWHFPGGGVEKNETANTALERELYEEAGIKMESPPRIIGLFANFRNFPSDHVALFLVPEWSRPHVPKPNAEIAETGFFAFNALPEGTTDAVRRRLDEIRGLATPSETW